MSNLVASDIMQRDLITVPPQMNLADLADFLIRERISGAPVVDPERDGAVVGMISRSDIVRLPVVERTLAELVVDREEAIAEARWGDPVKPLPQPVVADLARYTVRDAMVEEPISVDVRTPVAEVARTLVGQHQHRVLVCDGAAAVGLISSLDIVRLVAEGRLTAA